MDPENVIIYNDKYNVYSITRKNYFGNAVVRS